METPKSIHATLDELRRIRDEIRVRLRLGEMDARDWWASVEPKFDELEARLDESTGRAGETASIVTEELAAALRRIRDRLEQQGDQPSA
jgi:ElaB/YqjD/DUF883 family membrane-anchored ribosome-binding protein